MMQTEIKTNRCTFTCTQKYIWQRGTMRFISSNFPFGRDDDPDKLSSTQKSNISIREPIDQRAERILRQ
jgi:hypothetical protein